MKHDLVDDLAQLCILVTHPLELLCGLLKLLLGVGMLLLLLLEFLCDSLLVTIESGLLRCNLAIQHIHPVHLLVLRLQSL